ncbi:MAG: FHA domain-containing protein [Firmicutes bacterium]|nr:FHA domain-containing protein [Bacillota bacterium]
MKVKVEILSGPEDGQEYSITKSSDIGRDSANPIALTFDKFLSRRHSRILVAEPECFLEDIGSTNGTFIDGERLTGRILLENGKVFKVGQTWLQVSW